jgi:hypothetical protein
MTRPSSPWVFFAIVAVIAALVVLDATGLVHLGGGRSETFDECVANGGAVRTESDGTYCSEDPREGPWDR